MHDESEQTELEHGDGIIPAVRIKCGGALLATLEQLSATFDECVEPAKLEASTKGYQAAWLTVVTWGVAHESVHLLLPMSQATVKALTQGLLMVGCTAGMVKTIWSCIEARHKRFGHPLPLGKAGNFNACTKWSAQCSVHHLSSVFPVGVHRLKQLLSLLGLKPAQICDVLICATGTLLSCRVVELALLQICNFKWASTLLTMSCTWGQLWFRIYRSKQDTGGAGRCPRLGNRETAEHCSTTAQVRRSTWAAGQRTVHKAEEWRHKVPPLCAFLFLGEWQGGERRATGDVKAADHRQCDQDLEAHRA